MLLHRCSLLLAVDRSLLVDSVRDYSAHDFDSQEFQARFFLDKIKTCRFCLIAHWSGFIHKVSVTRARYGHILGSESIHTSTAPTTRGRTWISSGLIPPPTVWNSQPHRPISDWGSYVEPGPPRGDRVPSPVQRSFYIYKTSPNRGRKQNVLGSTPPRTVRKT